MIWCTAISSIEIRRTHRAICGVTETCGPRVSTRRKYALLRVAIGERCFAKTSRPIRPAPPKLFLADERRRDGDHRKHSAGEPRRAGDHKKHSADEPRRAGDHRKHSAGEPRRDDDHRKHSADEPRQAGDHRKHSAGEPRRAGDRWKFFARLKRAGAYWLLARVKTNLPKVNSTGKAAYRVTVAAPVSRMRLKRKGER